ncbi:TauD/TfdA family dioxygenase [Solwaraspora sp. WMMD1047]|uniref:TauD/TfdA family dioxygenase n=1 Tax=Solwaraspora sp. WMMD1047 TaxID=3016102 RepID=UPI002416130F|nr:TauD/TfdA family dioxygenase [Solwaraspora sp. WMMD1047]MDG4831467.1 TauD/TfdA family dioxygenase [Solwaraspora sp. WMMD1047]
MLGREIEHPLEHDDRDQHRDFTSVVTVRSVPSAGAALSTDRLPFHQDGLGTAGSVRYVAMCLDHGPIAGGSQFYVNLLAHGLLLAHRNWNRFVDATQADALTVTRFSGSQAVSVTGPMFYVDETGVPAAHFRAGGGEYEVMPSPQVAPWFVEFLRSLSHAAESVSLLSGDCIVVDNLSVAHARSAFTESDTHCRRLSRKWYAIDPTRTSVWNQASFRLDRTIYRDPE